MRVHSKSSEQKLFTDAAVPAVASSAVRHGLSAAPQEQSQSLCLALHGARTKTVLPVSAAGATFFGARPSLETIAHFFLTPGVLAVTLPMIACPPTFTLTCFTITRCGFPLARNICKVSTCWQNVRANLIARDVCQSDVS